MNTKSVDSVDVVGQANILTTFERETLIAIAANDFGDTLTSEVWTCTIEDYMSGEGPTGKALSGTVSSLVKKGLLIAYNAGSDKREHTVKLTDLGVRAYIQAVGSHKVSKPVS